MRIEIDDSDALPLIQNLSVLSDSACRSLCHAIKAGMKNDPATPVMRSRKEIQAAHDALIAALYREQAAGKPMHKARPDLAKAARALCWVLGHDTGEDSCFTDERGNMENLIQCAETLNEMAKDDQEDEDPR